MPGRVYRYRCPVCASLLDRRRRPGGDRWCARCASQALREGAAAFASERALVLVGVVYQGPERRPGPPADAGPVADAIGQRLPAAAPSAPVD